jgi:hypothetical protein
MYAWDACQLRELIFGVKEDLLVNFEKEVPSAPFMFPFGVCRAMPFICLIKSASDQSRGG